MNADRLLANFDAVVDTPGAVPRLRRFILDLAVRGKLVPQNPADEPASELLPMIARKKAQMIKEGEIRKPRDIRGRESRTAPFSIPSCWLWVTLDTVGSIVGGGTPDASNPSNFAEPTSGFPWLTPADLGANRALFISHGARDLTDQGLQASSATPMPEGTVLFTSRAPIGYVAIALNPISTNQGFKSVVPYVRECSRFIAVVLMAFAPEIDAIAPGTTFKEVSGKRISSYPFPLPPLAEQHRIVAKVDELMTLCDRLEAAREKREAARDRFAATSLNRLRDPEPDLPTFRIHAAFAIDNLDRLTARADQIAALRRTILDLAVRGKLLSHDPNDEPASALLKRIAKEKIRLAEAGEIRRQRPLPRVSREEAPFSLSEHWAWSQVAEIGVLNPRNRASEDALASFVPMSMISSKYGVSHRHEVRRWVEIKSGYTHFAEGDVGVAKITPCFENGKSTVFRNLAGGLGAGTTELHVVRPLFVDPRYVVLFFKSSYFIESGIPKMTGTAGQKRVPGEYFASAPFPLPPLAEQHRIVAKVDEMMTCADLLENRLRTAEDAVGGLLDAVLHEASRPEKWSATRRRRSPPTNQAV